MKDRWEPISGDPWEHGPDIPGWVWWLAIIGVLVAPILLAWFT